MKPAPPRPLRVVCGYCPTLGNAVRVTIYSDETCVIERQPYTRQQVSRFDGSVITTHQTFAVLTEPVKNHAFYISTLQQPAYWPE